MSVWNASKGESKDCMVAQEILALYWTRTRARPGEKVKLGAIVKDVKDGKKVGFTVFAGNGVDALATLDAKLQGGRAEAEWQIELPKGSSWPHDVTLVFDAVVDGKLVSIQSQRAELDLDLGLPSFST